MDKIKSLAKGETSELRIGFATSTIFSGLIAASQKHKELFPKVNLRLQELSSGAQVEANLGVSICPALFQKLKIGKVQYRQLEDVATEMAISVCFATANGLKLITPFLHLVKEKVAAGEG